MIRFGIVGAGAIARKFARDIKVVENAELVAVASRTIAKAKTFQKDFDLNFAFGSYQEMAESNAIDAVYIATPHSFHKEQTLLYLNHNKHVLCEKPLAVNLLEVEEMTQKAKDKNLVLMEAMWAIFLPANQFVLKEIQSGKLGKITGMDFSFGFDMGDLESAEDKRLLNKDLAGGSLLDVGVYTVAISQFFKNDEIANIKSKATFYKTGVDLRTDSIIEYKDGVILKTHSAINENLQNDAIITFEKGEIIIPNFWSSNSVIINGEKKEFPMRAEGFEYEIESFVKTIQNNELENNIMTHQVSKNVMMILDNIREIINLKYNNE